jgi:2-keto-4-pentenoate hydratase/2-oxohepta-3-ene-1,7-dioic acid hydratase in catechol pathway
MRFVRYQYRSDEPSYGWILDDRVGPVDGSPFGEYRRMNASLPIDAVRLLTPVEPSKIICVGRNYPEHAREHGAEIPQIPLLFLKPPTALIGPGQNIILPPQSQQVEHEAELAVVIGKTGRWIPVERTAEYIFGYVAANDVTARDLQNRDGQWTRGKGFDTFCPVGPWVETELNPADVIITCKVNDEMRQMASTREMVFTVPQLIAYASSIMTLMPGDILLTGTPAGVGPLNPADIVEVTVEGIGTLRNQVILETPHYG